ncbi:MAG: acyl-CoA dehydrogenase family protein [Candidatus Helarchaeota archaeon]|nr:acyl-CoA dehydrogenase family protein [Candidatus Helarchaeota archaeon]
MCAQEGNRNNLYSFDDYLVVRDRFDFYKDDEFFQTLVKHYTTDEFKKIDKELRELSEIVSFKWRDLANEATRLENRVKCTLIQHYDAHNHRIDRINRCTETETLEKGIFNLGLFDPNRNTPWSRFSKLFLLYELGEMGVMCPIVCTHGMFSLLVKYEEGENQIGPEVQDILKHIRNGVNGNGNGGYGIGAQFITEIQGGSDVPTNLVEAVYEEEKGPDGVSNCWRIYGTKFFCSAMQCDYALVSAKPKGTPSSTRVAVFAVPSWLPGNKEREIRNSYTINRLKQKLGTAELPTAEVTYNGAVAYPIGPLESGLADIVGVVLSLSRLHIGIGAGAAALRVAREATLYAQFRTAFGINVALFPMMINQINSLNHSAKRTAAATFKIYAEFIALGERLAAGMKELHKIKEISERKRRFRLRELIMLQKIVTCLEGPELIRLAISFYGGHGIMEDFTPLPRFHRDALIQELWEGPRNVLLTQIHRDFQRVADWYPADEFVRDIFVGADADIVEPLAAEFLRIMSYESLLKNDEKTLAICRDWEQFSNDLFKAYQEQALAELNYQGKPLNFSRLLREFKKREYTE